MRRKDLITNVPDHFNHGQLISHLAHLQISHPPSRTLEGNKEEIWYTSKSKTSLGQGVNDNIFCRTTVPEERLTYNTKVMILMKKEVIQLIMAMIALQIQWNGILLTMEIIAPLMNLLHKRMR